MVMQEVDSFSTGIPVNTEFTPLDASELERMSRDYARTRDPGLRETLILHHQRLVKSIAARFLGAGEALEDLVQVGNIGLINALDRYNPDQGTRFSTYATPTILGEIKRHFRDKTCGIKIPRWLQELHQAARRTSQQMASEMGRAPTIAEVAARLGASEEETLEALESGEAMNLLSLDTHLDPSGADSPTLLDLVGHLDTALRDFEVYSDLRVAMASLEMREREVISLRFFDELSQAKIAKKLNISQMHVSRLQQRALKRLREMLTDDLRTHHGYQVLL
jgi:RNA polymerase sigma-B factor